MKIAVTVGTEVDFTLVGSPVLVTGIEQLEEVGDKYGVEVDSVMYDTVTQEWDFPVLFTVSTSQWAHGYQIKPAETRPFYLGYDSPEALDLTEYDSPEQADYESEEWVIVYATSLEVAKDKYDETFLAWQKANEELFS